MSEYTDSFGQYTKGMRFLSTGLCPDCEDCASDHGISVKELNEGIESGVLFSEPGFSWTACELCGSSLGGNREPFHWVDDDGDVQHGFGACVDCMLYIANGDEPEAWEG